MFKFVCIYRQVDDIDALDDFFSATHLQLAEKLPGVVRTELNNVAGKPGGQSRFYRMYSLYFGSRKVFEHALASEVGQELMLALKPWADAKLITWFYTDAFENNLLAQKGISPPKRPSPFE